MDGVQRIYHVLLRDSDLCRHLRNGRLLLVLLHQVFPGINRLIGRVLQRTAHPDRVVVPEEPPDFPDDHGDGIGAEFHIERRIKVIDRLDQADTADLEQIVNIFAARGKTLDHAENQTKIPLDILLPRLLIPFLDTLKQFLLFFIGEHRQL